MKFLTFNDLKELLYQVKESEQPSKNSFFLNTVEYCLQEATESSEFIKVQIQTFRLSSFLNLPSRNEVAFGELFLILCLLTIPYVEAERVFSSEGR